MNFIAHITQNNDEWKTQSISEHSEAVAQLCKEYSAKLTADKRFAVLGEIIGRWHDVGKYQPDFQTYIKQVSGYDPTIKFSQKAPHSAVGALLAKQLIPHGEYAENIQRILAYCISSHHRGLYDINPMRNRLDSSEEKQRLNKSLNQEPSLAKAIQNDCKSMRANPIGKLASCPEDHQLLIRMLFSCLVDADFLDTEAFMSPPQSEIREVISQRGDFEQLRDLLKRKTEAFDRDSEINRIRNKFLEQCRANGQQSERGYYSLFLPTGGGKTLSSMTWALENAIHNGSERIIYVIPYTSIISQTAGVFREIFGDQNVLEHHSDIDIEDEDAYNRRKLLSENWDAPIVVTTTVQFFESLFASRPSKCRKLHNIANAVVVFDEVQMFPMPLLNPILRTLDALVAEFQTQVLFCTATLPLLDEAPLENGRRDVDFYKLKAAKIQKVVPYDKNDFDVFCRADFHLLPKELTIESLADEINRCDSPVLCVVNTRADAKKLFDAVCAKAEEKTNLIHLSRMMCSAHIKEVLADLKRRLKQGERLKVISTQLIEAGVDIDFPVVYRAESSLISIIQAGGRCNREGKLARNGSVYVFKLSDGSQPFGEIRQTAYATSDMINKYAQGMDLNDPNVIADFYRSLYGRLRFDEKEIVRDLWTPRRYCDFSFNFDGVATKFKMIEDKNEQEVLVPYGRDGEALVNKLRSSSSLNRQNYRTMQQYMVRLSLSDFNKLKESRSVASVPIGTTDVVYVLNHTACYNKNTGVLLDNPNNENPIII